MLAAAAATVAAVAAVSDVPSTGTAWSLTWSISTELDICNGNISITMEHLHRHGPTTPLPGLIYQELKSYASSSNRGRIQWWWWSVYHTNKLISPTSVSNLDVASLLRSIVAQPP